MGTKSDDADFDDSSVDDQYTDTSMFNAEEIVRNLEEEGARRQDDKAAEARRIDARRRAEIRRENKWLEEELNDLDGFEVEDWDGVE